MGQEALISNYQGNSLNKEWYSTLVSFFVNNPEYAHFISMQKKTRFVGSMNRIKAT